MRRRLASAAATLTALAAVAWLCASGSGEVANALGAVPAGAFAAAVALHVTTLVLRAEAWRVTLAAVAGVALSRDVVHAASAGAFLAGTAQSSAALPARVMLLRRMAGPRAPRPGQIGVADVPILVLELCFAAVLLAAGVAAGAGAWWLAPCALGVGAGALWGARRLLERFAHRPLARGLAVLSDVDRRGALLALVVTIGSLTVARVWLVLAVCGLPHGLGEVAWVFTALGAFGLLPLGPGASPGATLAALGAGGVGAAVAAGLVIGASSIAAAGAYAMGVAVWSRADRWMLAGARLDGAEA